jgi:psiF repeat
MGLSTLEISMRLVVLCSFALAALLPMASFAEGVSCNAAAAEKKLAGAAKTSFLKKCTKDAAATCDMASAEKKLAGAAKTSFTKKCNRDAVG